MSIGLIYCIEEEFTNYCYEQRLPNILFGIITLSLAIYQIIYRKTNFKYGTRRKNNFYFIIIISVLCYLIFNINQEYFVVFFFLQIYFYYVFLVYLVYYFARKTVKIKTFNQSNMYQITIYCYSLLFFFSIFLIWNVVQYSFQPYSYVICQRQIFHIIRIVGFIVDLILVVIAHILNEQIKQHINENSDLMNNLGNGSKTIEKINSRRWYFWVFSHINKETRQLIYFFEDIFFLVEGTLLSCQIIAKVQDNNEPFWKYLLIILAILIGYLLPFLYVLYIFWFNDEKVNSTQQSLVFFLNLIIISQSMD
ncbi:hypothetical protein pb186bvf_016226 [Paramecium bursaria]